MKLDTSPTILLALLPTAVQGEPLTSHAAQQHMYTHYDDTTATASLSNNHHRTLQTPPTSSCLAQLNFNTTFTHTTCTPDQITLAISNAIVNAGSACDGASTESELATLLNTTEDAADIHTALEAKCNEAFTSATLPFRKITKKGDAFDREFFAGGSTWNDHYQTSIDGTSHHNLQYEASRIMYEVQANTASMRPIEFPNYLTQFDNCDMGAVMCCHVSDRQANDLEGSCTTGTSDSDGCADADPLGNTDVCVANMEDAQVSNRVQRGLAVYDVTEEGGASEGDVNCHGFAWDSGDVESDSNRYKGNMLFDVAFKQSLYDKGYVKNIPGAPMCGCIEQMPTVTRADCTKITSVAETYTLSATVKKPTLFVELTDSGVQYGPCDAEEDLASHYKTVNADNTPDAIDTKLVGEGGCRDAIDSSMQVYGYKRSTLELTEAYFIPQDLHVNPNAAARVVVKFSTEVTEDAATMTSFKVYDVANHASELGIAAIALTFGNRAVELTLSDPPSSSVSYQVTNVDTLHKRIAPMITLEAGSSPTDIAAVSFRDELQIGENWKLAQMLDDNHFSISARALNGAPAQTSMVYQSNGYQSNGDYKEEDLLSGPREDFNAWSEEPTYSLYPFKIGDKTVEINNWRIRQVYGDHYLSITHVDGRIVRLYRKDGATFPKFHIPVPQGDEYSAYADADLGEPTCTFLTDKFLQIGNWRIGEFDSFNLSVNHKDGWTSLLYKRDGTAKPVPSLYYSTWDESQFPIGPILQGTTSGCEGSIFA